MRLAIIRQRYNPFGGAERFVERAVQALARQGTTVNVIAREWHGGTDGAADPNAPAPATWLRCDPRFLGRRARDASFARAACALVARERFDLVQSHERLSCCDIYRAGDGVHRQWLAYRSRSAGALERATLATSPYHRYVLAAERAMFASERLRAVICNSQMVRADILRHFAIDADKLHVIYNGVDTDRFHPAVRERHRQSMRGQLGIDARAFVYLFVGSGFERKGVPALLHAFAALKGAGECRVVIVGKDKAAARMQRLARQLGHAERVLFAGPQHDVLPWYGLADCFVLPTQYDPFPNAALEALACGLPLITSTQCGAAELINDANGLVCDPLDVAALARAMEDARAFDASRASASARASVSGLSLSAMAEQLVALYQRLLNH